MAAKCLHMSRDSYLGLASPPGFPSASRNPGDEFNCMRAPIDIVGTFMERRVRTCVRDIYCKGVLATTRSL